MRRALAGFLLAFLVVSPSGLASESSPTLRELEGELMCPTCEGETLVESDAPAAERVRQLIRRMIAGGAAKSEIKGELERQFGPQILAAPPRRGFDALAWLLPLGGMAAAAVVVGLLAWRWSRGGGEPRPPAADPSRNGRPEPEPELERRLDEELARFD